MVTCIGLRMLLPSMWAAGKLDSLALQVGVGSVPEVSCMEWLSCVIGHFSQPVRVEAMPA